MAKQILMRALGLLFTLTSVIVIAAPNSAVAAYIIPEQLPSNIIKEANAAETTEAEVTTEATTEATETTTEITGTATSAPKTAAEIADQIFPKIKKNGVAEPTKPLGNSSTTFGGITFAVGDNVQVDEALLNDLFLAGNAVTITQPLGSDLFVGANTITIDNGADIKGSLRAAGNTVSINSTVGGNALVFANSVTIGPKAVIKGHLNVYAAALAMNGTVNKKLYSAGEQITINGEVKDTATIDGDRIIFGPNAILHDTTTVAAEKAEKNVTISPQTTGADYIKITKQTYKSKKSGTADPNSRLSRWLLSFIFFTVLGIIMMLLWPKRLAEITKTMIKKPALAWSRGALFVLLTPLAALVLMFTIIGLPLAIIGLIAYVLLLCVARIFSAMMLGQFLMDDKVFSKDKQKWNPYVQFICGYFILSIIFSIPWIGWLVCALAATWGVGGLLSTKRQKRKKK